MRKVASFIIALTIAALLAACGGPAATPAPAPAPTEAEAEAPPATEAASETRIIQHVMGEAAITGTPERVVALEWTYVEDVLALGLQPIGIADIEGYNDWVKTPIALSPDTAEVGFRGEPNMETLVGLRPDLIIEINYSAQNYYDDLSGIAPTLVFEPYPEDPNIDHYEEMRSTLLAIAEATNRVPEGEAALQHLDDHLAAARAEIEEAGLTGEKFVLAQAFSWDSGASVRLFTDNSMAVKIVEQLGIENAWDDGHQAYGFTEVSVETLSELGDVHFFYVLQDGDTIFSTDTTRPLWESLEFVKAGNDHPIGGDTWLFGGPLSAELLADKVVSALLETAAAETRSVTHAMGVTEVPANPQRVVVLDTGELDNALALGAMLVGAPIAAAEEYQGYLGEDFAGVGDTGGVSEPNLEAILALEPDLILGSKQRHEEIYEQLSQIAPTVLTESLRVAWQDNFRLHAEALGRTEEAEALLAEYEAHVEEVRAALGDDLDTLTISVIRFRPDQVRLYLRSSYIGYILQDVGLNRPEAQAVDEFAAEISLEQVGDADADYIFVTGYDVEDSAKQAYLDSAVWQTLSAVQAGNVIDVDDDTWVAGLGIQAANHVLDDLITHLAQ